MSKEPMYNESYHSLQGENLKDALVGLTETQKKEFVKQNSAAADGKIRDFFIVLKPPTTGSMYDGSADGVWMHIVNGQMIGSCYQG
jgi:hypothetical protein